MNAATTTAREPAGSPLAAGLFTAIDAVLPDPETIRARLEIIDAEADLLRRLMRLSLRRAEERRRLQKGGAGCA